MTRSRSTPRTRSRGSTTASRVAAHAAGAGRMEHGAALGARERLERGVGGRHAVAGQVLLAGDEAAKRRLRVDLAQHARGPRRAPWRRADRSGSRRGCAAARAGRRSRSRRCRVDSGRHCAADAEKPEKRCSGSPGLSTESGMTLNSTSARPPLACSVATRPPTWPAPTVSGPRCAEQPLRAHLREAQRIADVVVERALLLQLDDHARLVVVLQVARRPRAHRRRRRCRARAAAPPGRCPRAAAAAATAARRRRG